MSDIKWCDIGGHAFSVNDPDRKSFVGPEDRQGNRERIDICGPHVVSNAMGVKPLTVTVADSRPEVTTVKESYPDHTHAYGTGTCPICGASGVAFAKLVAE